MNLNELIKNISNKIEILNYYHKEAFFGVMIEYCAFKIKDYYFLVSKELLYGITEQNPEGTKDISDIKIFNKKELIEYIKRLVITKSYIN